MEAKDLHALRARPEYLGQPLHCGAHGGAPGTDSNDTQQHILPPDNFQTPLTTTAQTDQFYFFLKKKKKKGKGTNQATKTRQPPGSQGYWACVSVGRPLYPLKSTPLDRSLNTLLDVGGAV